MTSSRCLRLAILLDGRLVEERICDGATPITLGQSLKCTLSIPVEGVPREHVLFARAGDGFELRPVAGGAAIAIARGARGKLQVGEATILYQEVARPPAAPPPRLPASVRGTLADRIDRRLAAIIGASLVVHVAIAAWAWQADLDTGGLGTAPPQGAFTTATIDDPGPGVIDLAPPVAAPPPAPGIARAVAPAQVAHPIVRPGRTPGHASAPRAPTRDDAAALAGILTGPNDAPGGPAGMSARRPGADLDEQLREVHDRHVTLGGDHVSRGDDRARLGTGVDPLPIDDPSLTRIPTAPDDVEPGRIRIVPAPEQPGDDPMPDQVLEKIVHVYLTGLRRCYARALATDPSLSGKLGLELTVDERGRVRDPEVTGGAPDLAACVTAQTATWRFAPAKDAHGAPADATYHITLVLRPS